LVDEKLDVFVADGLGRLDDLTEIGLHQVGYNIDLIECLQRLGLQNVLDSQDVVVVQQSHDLQLAQGSECKNFVFKRFLNLLDRD